MEEKVGLVLCGGGSQGAYEYGVWKFLREKKMHFDIITGTSIGAINGAMITYDGFDECGHLWETTSIDNVFKDGVNFDKNFLSRTFSFAGDSAFGKFIKAYSHTGGADITPFKNLVRSSIDAKKVLKSDILLGVIYTDKKGMKEARVTNRDMKKADDVFDYLFASSAAFPIFPIYKCDKGEFLDGGWKNNLPIDYALELGATKIVAVRLYSFPKVPQKKELMDLPCVTVIEPSWDLGSIMKFKTSAFKRSIDLGYFDACKVYGKYKGFKYTFSDTKTNDEFVHNFFLELLKGFDYKIDKINYLFNLEHRFMKCDEDYLIRAFEYLAEELNISPFKSYSLKSFCKGIVDLIENDPKFLELSKLSKLKLEGMFLKSNLKEYAIVSYYFIKNKLDINNDFTKRVIEKNEDKYIIYLALKYIVNFLK